MAWLRAVPRPVVRVCFTLSSCSPSGQKTSSNEVRLIPTELIRVSILQPDLVASLNKAHPFTPSLKVKSEGEGGKLDFAAWHCLSQICRQKCLE